MDLKNIDIEKVAKAIELDAKQQLTGLELELTLFNGQFFAEPRTPRNL